ncbi:MAG: hypothetical protein R2737_01975 [Candidatus Nanopelagicales bacterium]
MSTSWVAASVRARAMSRRRLGAAGARALAALPDLPAAVDRLAATSYGHDVRAGQDLAAAQHAAAATALWHLRVLGGWVPHGDASVLRVLAGAFEIADVDERLRELAGRSTAPPFRLGALAVVSTRIPQARSAADLRLLLARSAWGDPGGDDPATVRRGMRLSWARRVAAVVPHAHPWAAGAAALLVAREYVLAGRRPSAQELRTCAALLGDGWVGSRSVGALSRALPAEARWPLADVTEPDGLWRAEALWWARVERDGFALMRRPLTGPEVVVGAVAVLGVDAWRVRAALEVAARTAALGPTALEAFDAVA